MRQGVHPETSCACSCPTSCRASRACRAGHQQQQGISTLFPTRHGFPYVGRMSGMSGAPDFMGTSDGTDGRAWAGCGPWEAWGDARRTGRLFSLGGWPFRASTPGLRSPYGAGAAAWMRRGVHPETSCVCSCPTSCQRHNKNPARAGIEPTYRRHKHARAPSQSGYTCGESIRLACLPRAVNRSYFLISVQNFLTFRL